ncbi:hypothetical protein [Oerskovia flava]|uniref:hypothetical protein n=1 Tax=Oerskovia flava TaxID=2986422 RepID=UPI00223FFF91|nr:hypothetical protein [Oerskovia sp. JB1-3-2]
MHHPTPTYFSSGPHATVEQAMAALSDALELALEEDRACGMLPTVEHMSLDVQSEDSSVVLRHTAVALVLISYRRDPAGPPAD